MKECCAAEISSAVARIIFRIGMDSFSSAPALAKIGEKS